MQNGITALKVNLPTVSVTKGTPLSAMRSSGHCGNYSDCLGCCRLQVEIWNGCKTETVQFTAAFNKPLYVAVELLMPHIAV